MTITTLPHDVPLVDHVRAKIENAPTHRRYMEMVTWKARVDSELREVVNEMESQNTGDAVDNAIALIEGKPINVAKPKDTPALTARRGALEALRTALNSIHAEQSTYIGDASARYADLSRSLVEKAHERQRALAKQLIGIAIANGVPVTEDFGHVGLANVIHSTLCLLDPCAQELDEWTAAFRDAQQELPPHHVDALSIMQPVHGLRNVFHASMRCRLPLTEVAEMVRMCG